MGVDVGLDLWIRSGTPLTLDVSKANSTARLGAPRLEKVLPRTRDLEWHTNIYSPHRGVGNGLRLYKDCQQEER